jgi:nucleolin
VFRRFNSDEASQQKTSLESADGEHGSVQSAIESASESASAYANEASERVSDTFDSAKESVVDAATFANDAVRPYTPRERRPTGDRYGDRNGRQQQYNDRGGYGDSRRGGYQDRNDRGMDRVGDRRGDGLTPRVIAPNNGIYIGNLLFDVTSEDLKREFEQFGQIQSAVVATDARGLSKGYIYSLAFEIRTDVCVCGH